MARGITMPAQAPKAWITRNAIRILMPGASAQPMLPTAKIVSPRIDRQLAPDDVAQGAVEELADADDDEEHHQAHLHGARAGLKAFAHRGQSGQVHVDRERADRGNKAEHDRHAQEAASHWSIREGVVGWRYAALTAQRFNATSAKWAPIGSTHWTIHCPPGTSVGPMMILPPAALTRSAAASIASTLK